MVADADGRTGLIDWHGEIQIPLQYHAIEITEDGTRAICKTKSGADIYELTYEGTKAYPVPAAKGVSETRPSASVVVSEPAEAPVIAPPEEPDDQGQATEEPVDQKADATDAPQPAVEEEPTASAGSVSSSFGEAAIGDQVSLSVYEIEPWFEVLKATDGGLLPLVTSDTKIDAYAYVCKAYLDGSRTDAVWVLIDGADYRDHVSDRSQYQAIGVEFQAPATLTGTVVYADQISDDLAAEIDSNKLLVFDALAVPTDRPQLYDGSAAVPFDQGVQAGSSAFVDGVYRVEVVSYTYSSVMASLENENELDRFVCECRLDDGQGTRFYLVIEPDDYVASFDRDLVYEFDSSALFDPLSGNFEVVYLDPTVRVCGLVEDSEEIIEGLADTAGAKVLVFDHLG